MVEFVYILPMQLRALAPKTPRSQRTRSRILEAAGRCFSASGYAKTTVEEIAAGAGVSKALVYNHFEGKEDVLQAVLEQTLDEWHAMSGLDSLAEPGHVLEAIGRMQRNTVAFAQERPLLRALFQLDTLVVIGIGNRAVRDSMELLRSRLQAAIELGIETGELRSDLDPRRVTDVVRILHMAMVDHILNPEWIDVSDEALVDASLEVLFHGIAGQAARS